MTIIIIDQRGQIVLPRTFIDALGLKPGDSLAIVQHAQELILRPLKETLLDLRGSIHVSSGQDVQAIREQVKATIGQKAAGDDA